jgi:hypothetical protein
MGRRQAAAGSEEKDVYGLALTLHSWIRWLVVITAALALLRAYAGWLGRRPWTPADDKAGRWFTIGMDVQLLLGLLLYVALSPFTTQALRDFGAAMREAPLRFWAVEHVFMMVVALALVHVGRVRVRRAATPVAKHRAAAIFFTLSLLAVLAGIPWPGSTNGRPLFRI